MFPVSLVAAGWPGPALFDRTANTESQQDASLAAALLPQYFSKAAQHRKPAVNVCEGNAGVCVQ